MTTQMDVALGLKEETTYGTYVAPDKFPEFLTEDFAWEPTFSEGNANRYGRRAMMANRRVLVKEQVTGSFEMEAVTKGLGILFKAALGTAVSNVISGSAHQQLITPTITDPLPSFTIQKGIPLVGGGAAQPMSFVGCVCTGFELSAKNGAIPTLKFNWVGKGVDTGQVFATPSYPSALELFSFTGGSIRAAGGGFAGAVTPPTTTALASGGTALADVTEIDLTFTNGADEGGFFVGGGGKRGRKQAVGVRGLTGTLVAEYDSNTLRDAFLNQTDLALVLKFEHSTVITGAIKPTLEITIPVIRLDGELPKAGTPGEVITQSIGFTMLDGGVAAHPVYVAIVTAETAI